MEGRKGKGIRSERARRDCMYWNLCYDAGGRNSGWPVPSCRCRQAVPALVAKISLGSC